MMVWLYILECADGSFYVGTTRASVERRIDEHNSGVFGGYTAVRRPVVLRFAQEFQRADEAIAQERRLKGWSRAKKSALIEGRYELLPLLAKNRQG